MKEKGLAIFEGKVYPVYYEGGFLHGGGGYIPDLACLIKTFEGEGFCEEHKFIYIFKMLEQKGASSGERKTR